MRYIDVATGRMVSFSTVESVLTYDQLKLAAEARAISMSLVSGRVSLAEWQLQMARIIKRGEIVSGIAGRGGLSQMTPADWGFIGYRVKEQYKYLRNFVKDIISGHQKLDGTLVYRASMYAKSAMATFSEIRRRLAKRLGFTEERRILSPVEHCQPTASTPGCVELAAKGWQPIGSLPAIGEATCIVNCRCHFEYRRPPKPKKKKE